MRAVLDTNVLISSLIVPDSPTHRLYEAWRAGAFTLATCEQQLEEFRAVTRYPKVRRFIEPAHAGLLLNEIRQVAEWIEKLPKVSASPDPNDNFLLALAQASNADYLVSGDKSGLLALKRHGNTCIVSVKRFLELVQK